MNLRQLLTTLSDTKVNVKIVDLDTDKEIVSINAAGVDSLDDAIEARPVKRWSIVSTTQIKVVLDAPIVEETPTTEPTTTDQTSQTTEPATDTPSTGDGE